MAEQPEKQAEMIFYQALEKEPAHRDAYLKEACAGNCDPRSHHPDSTQIEQVGAGRFRRAEPDCGYIEVHSARPNVLDEFS